MIYMYVMAFWRCHFECHVVGNFFFWIARYSLTAFRFLVSNWDFESDLKKISYMYLQDLMISKKNHLVWFLLCLYDDRNSGENNKWTYKFPFFQMHFWFQIAGSLQICTNMVVYHYMYQQLIILLLWSVIEFDLPTSNCTRK